MPGSGKTTVGRELAKRLGRRFVDLLHFDESERIDQLLRVSEERGNYRVQDTRQQRLLQMLAYQVEAAGTQACSGEDFLERLTQYPELCDELGELAQVLASRSLKPLIRIPGLEDAPLSLHASYGIREILTAVGWLTAMRRTPFQAGVLALYERQVELLFVTLDKRDGYHERIAYHDYAISPERFHWQSQNAAGPETKAGQRYLNSPHNGWQFQLFVRGSKGKPYVACGPVVLERAEGGKPMTIYWRLETPLPIRLYQQFSVLRDA